MALSSGTWLNHYEILGHLGTGGMGEVYRARDNKLQREVALKVLPKAFAQDPERVAPQPIQRSSSEVFTRWTLAGLRLG